MALTPHPRLGWAVAATSAGLVAFWLVLGGLRQAEQLGLREFLETEYGNIVFGLAFPVVGAMILTRVQAHRLGWLYSLSGLACALALASYTYAQRGLVEQPGALPGALGAAWLSSWIWVCGFSPLITFGILAFPDGRLPSRRWWPVAALAGSVIIVGVVSVALRPGPLENHPVRDNPLGLRVLRAWSDTLNGAWLPVLFLAIVGSFAALVVRYRSGSAAQKDQSRWFVVAACLIMVSFAIPANSPVGFVGNLLILLAIPLFPLSVGVAVMRARLDDVGVALRRSLVYGWLVAGGLSLYAAVILIMDALLRGHAQPFAALLGAGAVAVSFQPLRLRLQRSADRMLYGDRGDPYAVATELGRRLEAAGSAEQALTATVAAIAEALRLPYVAIELPGGEPGQPIASTGSVPRGDLVSIPLRFGGEDVGCLLVGQRDEREPFTARERQLLRDLGRQVAVAAHGTLLDQALRRSLKRQVLAREEERLRLRRDLHDGLGPSLAGVALGVDAARNMLSANERDVDELLGQLKDETLDCVAEVRRILDDLRPPTLDEVGLLPALQSFADRLSSRNDVLQVVVDVDRALPPLPPAVELAAFRIATEAMTNVARHAEACRCRLRLCVGDDLTLEVWDDGIGIPAERRQGVGTTSMANRAAEIGGECVVLRAAGGGTQVVAHLPLVTT